MGLDMYLYVETYNPAADGKEWFAHSYTLQCVAYWRKSNEIHNWFVNEIQEGIDKCNYSPRFGADQLHELVKLCKKVIKSPKKAPDLLPTTSGFFFGSTEYDESYFESVSDTIKQLEAVLKAHPDGSFIYRSSW